MNIQLQLKANAIVITNNYLETIFNESSIPIGEENKLVKSLCFDVSSKFSRKHKDLIKKSIVFDSKKKHKITLKYHEAFGLYHFLIKISENETNDYIKLITKKLIDNLHQQII